jgi:hypothetical protein
VTLLSLAGSWPAWAETGVVGEIGRMGRIVFDPEAGRTWVSRLQVDVTTREIETEWGPTRTSEAVDRILVKSRGRGRYTRPVDVSAGQPDAKLDPRIAAAGGKAAVAWCALDHSSRQWRVFAASCPDGRNWSVPAAVAGGERPALHPSLDLDPIGGRVWIAYEDWSDGAIYLTGSDGDGWSAPLRLSEGGKNYRPKVIVTKSAGRHGGAVAVAWDSYRDGQYDIYLRLLRPDGSLGPELRVTQSPLWDKEPDLAEDHDGNLWVVWIRASNELCESNRLREVHARLYDGEKWRWPKTPADVPPGNGRLTGYNACMHPRMVVDDSNRVHLFYRDLAGALFGNLFTMTYLGDRWTASKKIKDGDPHDAINVIWDYSMAVNDRNTVVGVWDSLYVKRLGFAAAVNPTRPLPLPPVPTARYRTAGEEGEETIGPGWTRLEKPAPRTMPHDGQTLTLLFGDTHNHSCTSDGIDPPDWYYHFARDFARLDYYALSDHDFTVCNTPGIEAYIAFLPQAFNRPDFVTFQAYEFSSQKTGHRVVVFEGNDQPTFPMTYPPRNISNTHVELYRFLHKFAVGPDSRVLVTAHNMFQMGNSFIGLDPTLEPLYDVTSLHSPAEKHFRAYAKEGEKQGGGIWVLIGGILALGQSREEKQSWHMCWRECLDADLGLGAYGSSDSHQANGLGYVTSALWVREYSRPAIFDAMFQKRSLGLDSNIRTRENETAFRDFPYSHAAMLRADVRFFLDNYFMGSDARLDAPPYARVSVANLGRDQVRAVVFVKDGKEEHTVFGDGSNLFDAEWKDEGWVAGRHYYYARVDFQSGSSAFSSPVFVKAAAK